MELIVKDLNGLTAAARELLPILRGRGVVALYGGMGAGKTTLVSALVREMGSDDEVSSPTFALVNDYVVPGASGYGTGGGNGAGTDAGHVYHFDFYRIDSLAEAFDLGYEEYFYSGGLCLVEWPEKIEELLPDDTLRIRIDTLNNGSRVISISNRPC
jgi:tRNA threonylcarbamoyladenosine biosynthesis protein TsaE